MMKKPITLLSVVVFGLLIVSITYVIDAQQGSYVYNQTGTIVNLGEIKDLNIQNVVMSFYLSENNTLYIYGGALNLTGTVPVSITISNPNGTVITNIDFTVSQGENFTKNIIINDTSILYYIVLNATVNGIETGFFAVPKAIPHLSEIDDIKNSFSDDPSKQFLIALIVNLVAFSPLIGIYLRGKMRESGIGSFILGAIFMPTWMGLYGINPQIILLMSSIAILSGIVLVLMSRENE